MSATTRRHFLRGPLAAAGCLAIAPGALRALTEDPKAVFFAAVASGDVAKVTHLLDQTPSLLSATDSEGRSAFAVALLRRQPPVAELLRGRGYAPDLHESALALDWERFAELAEGESEAVDGDHPIGGTAMYAAAAGGAGDQIWRVYAAGGHPNAVPPGANSSALLMALAHPDLATAEITAATLLGNGADSSPRKNEPTTPLHRAAQRGSLELVEMLLRKGAPVKALDADGHTPRAVAERGGHRQVAQRLEKHHEIARDHSTSRRAYDLEGKPYRPRDLTSIPIVQRTDFVGTAHRDLDELKRRAEKDPRLPHSISTTTEGAVEAGAHMGRRDIVDFLLDQGAPYSLPTAVMRSDTKRIAELLVEDPQRIHERGAHDFALLWYPVIGQTSVEIAEQLVKAGAEVEEQHFLGTTALHFAAMRGNLELAAYFLSVGADPKRRGRKFDGSGQTPLELAEERGHEEIAKLLREKGA